MGLRYARKPCLCLGPRCRGLVAFAIMLPALLSGNAAPRVDAQATWDGTVEVSPRTLTIREGEFASYRMRLTKPPTEDADKKWWVMMHVDGERRADGQYKSIRWVPSIGREFDRNNYNQWQDVRIYANQDDDAEDLFVTFTHEVWDHNADCPVHGVGEVTVHVIDDDGDGGGSLPTLTIADATVSEGDTAEFVVTLSSASEQAVTVRYRTESDTAVEGADYNAAAGELRFVPGTTRQTIEVVTREDETAESEERFAVTLSDPTGATLADDTAAGTITDDDDDGGGSLPTLTIADATVSEGDTAEFVVTLSSASEQAVTVRYRTESDTAVEGADYNAAAGELRFVPGTTRQTIEVVTREDETAESEERFAVTLSDPTGATLADDTAAGTITDDDDDGGGSLPTLTIADATVSEGDTAEFVVTLSSASEQAVTVRYRTESDTAVEGADYNAAAGELRFVPGTTRQTIEVVTREDETAESEERFAVTLSDPTGATLADDTAAGTITDDDDDGGGSLPTLTIADATVSEGDTAEFVVTLSSASEQAVTVRYRTESDTAVEGADYNAAAGELRFVPGTTRQTIEVVTREDETAESEERFAVTLSDPTGATLADDTAAGTITDDDDDGGGSLPTLTIADATVSEGDTAEFVVTLSSASEQAVTVRYRTESDTAVEGADYNAAAGELRFVPGTTRQTIEVVTREDETAESEERFAVTLSDPTGATLADDTAAGTITDDDDDGGGSLPTLTIADATVSEGDTAEFVVTLSSASEQAVTVRYRTTDGTALAGFDYAASEGTLRLEPGETTRTVAVAALPDELVEGAEQFTVELSDPVGAMVADGTGVGTITDRVERFGLVNRTVLPEVGRALAFTAVTCRMDRALSASTARDSAERPVGHLSLSHALTSDRWNAPAGELLTLERAFRDSSLLMRSKKDEEAGAGRFAAWGCGDYRNLASGGEGSADAWDGEVFSVHLGADVRLDAGVLTGLSVSRSRGSFDYNASGRDGDAGGGAYDLRLTGVHPYLGWSVSPDLDMWGTVGHAWGEFWIVDNLAGGPRTSAATLDSGAVGVSGRLLARGATMLKLKGEGALARLDIAGDGETFGAVTVAMRRLRLSTEASHEHVFSSGRSLTPWGELGLRHDGGDGETGTGLEVGGGLRYQDPETGLTAEGAGRWLAMHEGTLREWGFGALIRFDPGAAGRGPSVSLTPAWGETASGVQRLWERGATNPTMHDAPGTRLNAQFGYGFAAFRARGVLTPFGMVSLTGKDGQGYRLGSRLAMGRSATVSLEATRRERAAAGAVHAVMVRGGLRF